MGIALLVYADTYQRYCHWCHQNDLSPRNPLLQHVRGEREVQGRYQRTPILLVDPAPWWLIAEIASRRLLEVTEVPDPLVEFIPELDDYDYNAGDIADLQWRRTSQVDARARRATWTIVWRVAIVLLMLFSAAYMGYIVGVTQGA